MTGDTVPGMAMDKVTMTLHPGTTAAARLAAQRSGTSLSAYTDRALRDAMLRDAMDQLAADGYRGPGDDWYETIERDAERGR
jgi:hypothetical protein